MSVDTPFPPPRRHTWYFLNHVRRNFHPVYLSMEVDLGAVRALQAEARAAGRRTSLVAHVVHAIARALRTHPEANVSVLGGLRPRLVRYERITAKVAMDKRVGETRAVVSGTVEDPDVLTVEEIARRIDYYRDRPLEETPEFRPLRALQRLPMALGQLAYNAALSAPERREALQGSFAVSSLSHRPVREFFPLTSTTTCFGLGAPEERVVVRAGETLVRPLLPVSMTFDHGALDGALAADVLAAVKARLEDGGRDD